MNDERLIEIETKIAHHEMAIEELNDVIRSQQETIDKLETTIKTITSQFSQEGKEAPANEKPPHY